MEPGLQENVHITFLPTVQRRRDDMFEVCDASRMMTQVIDIPLSATPGGVRVDYHIGIFYLFLSLSVLCDFFACLFFLFPVPNVVCVSALSMLDFHFGFYYRLIIWKMGTCLIEQLAYRTVGPRSKQWYEPYDTKITIIFEYIITPLVSSYKITKIDSNSKLKE